MGIYVWSTYIKFYKTLCFSDSHWRDNFLWNSLFQWLSKHKVKQRFTTWLHFTKLLPQIKISIAFFTIGWSDGEADDERTSTAKDGELVETISEEMLESGCKSTGGTTYWELATLEEDRSWTSVDIGLGSIEISARESSEIESGVGEINAGTLDAGSELATS